MKPLDILINARELIRLERNWTKGTNRRDRHGRTAYNRNDVSSFCAVGAILHVTGGRSHLHAGALESMSGVTGGSMTHYNDTHTHAEVLALFDAAIERGKLEARKTARNSRSVKPST